MNAKSINAVDESLSSGQNLEVDQKIHYEVHKHDGSPMC